MKKLLRTAAMVAAMAAMAAMAFSCDKPDNPTTKDDTEEQISSEEQQKRQANIKALKYLREEIMDDYYYWYSQIPDVKYTGTTDIYDYFDDLLYSKDRWSWMIDGQEYIADESGVVYGSYGASFGQPRENDDYNVYVRYVYPNSPFANAGVQRGYRISSIDGHGVLDYWLGSEAMVTKFNNILLSPSTTESHSFQFTTPEGKTVEKSIKAAETLNTRPCLIKRIFTAEDYPGLTEPVGYFNYLGFKADDDVNGKTMLDDITEPMAYFKENGVKTIIVDLRYNGGGDSRASDLLVSYLAPTSAAGEIYVKRTHNDKLKSMDKTQTIETPENVIAGLKKSYGTSFSCEPSSPEFEHLYFITGKGSASASEMTLNGLKPLADLKHVGGVTYGKPNGMYVFLYPYDAKAQARYAKDDYSSLKYVFLPICFYNANGEGQHIPDDGLIPDDTRPDDIYHDFGVEEDNIAACLYNIVNGSYPPLTKAKTRASRSQDGPKVKLLLNEEDTDPNYGMYVVRPDFL